MIAKTLPPIDQMLGAISSTAPAVGDVAATGTTPFDQLMASLTLPSATPQAPLQPGTIAPISFQPAVPTGVEASPVPGILQPAAAVSAQPATVAVVQPAADPFDAVAPVSFQPVAPVSFQPVAPTVIPVAAPVAASPVAALAEATTALLDSGKIIDKGDESAAPIAPAAEAPVAIAAPVIAQPAPDAAAILAATGIQMPVQAVATPAVAPAKTEAAASATAAITPAILQNVTTPPVLARPAKVTKSDSLTPGIAIADKSVAQPFGLEGKVDTPVAAEQPVPVEITLAKADAAPVTLLHKPAADAIALTPAAPANEVNAATQTELASHAMETRLDVAQDAQWIDRAAKDIAQLANGEGRLRFRLDPDHLGALQIDMANGSDGLSMRMTAETEAARVILADAQPRLIAEARAQGVRIAEAHIDMGQHSNGGGRQPAQDQQPINTRHQNFEGETADTTATPASNERFA